jgi:peptide/nickel transport system ATP-binding protein
MSPILDIENVTIEYPGNGARVLALDGASLRINAGETVGLVGESGSGKTSLGLLAGRLLPRSAMVTGGQVRVDGQDVLALDDQRLRALRRECLGYIPQDPVAALDPTMRIGRQLELVLQGLPHDTASLRQHLDSVQINEPDRVLRLFPHEISGGMAQRVMIAMAMARTPRLLVADEPTASLDSHVRTEVTKLIFSLAAKAGATVLWLSHDLRSVSRWCQRVVVMYGGKVMEDGPAAQVLRHPTHPYTIALAASDPARAEPGQRIGTKPFDPAASDTEIPSVRMAAGGAR